MTRTAAAARTATAESSSLTTSSSSSAMRESSTESTTETSVIPPAYMSTSETLGASTPNYSSIDSDRSSYCSTMSDDLANMAMPESETSVPEDASTEATSEADAETAVEEETAESGEGGESETSEEEVSEEETAEAASEEVSEEETAEEEEAVTEGEEGEGGEEESEENSDEEGSASGGGASSQEEAEGIEAIVTKLPRMTPIRTPYVASAPPQAVERRDEIIKRTGSSPELHHAKVRQTVELVAQAARDAQRRMVWAIGNIAKDTRISIEEMADEIMQATSAAVGQINGAINTAMTDIESAAVERMEYLDEATILTGEELEANRDFTNQAIAAELTAGSESVTALNDVATESFDGYVAQGAEKIRAIPGQGDVEPIPAPSSSSGGDGESSDSGSGDEGEAPDYQIMADADIHLQEFLQQQSGIVGAVGPQAASYYGFRAAPVLTGMEGRTETQLSADAETKATGLDSAANRAQFLIMLLGLTTPVSKYHENDQTEVETENERELLSQMTEAEAAHYRANQTITQKCEMAKEYADRDLRENLTSNLWKAGRKGAQGLRKQAATAEVTLNNTAVPMAEAYRDLIARLNALLPPGQFLDSREIIPKVLAAREQAIQLQAQHEAAAKEQALATEAQMEEVKKQQVDGLFKAASDSMQSITDVVTQTSFDMELFVMQMTGSMRVGAGACMTAAQDYADRTAEGIVNSITGASGPGMDRVNSVAVGFINGQISMAEQAQFQQLSGFVENMEQTGENGPLTKPMFDAQSDLNTRTTALDNAMPERSTGTAVALGVVSPVALGVYLYCTDPSEDTVLTQLGGLMWPGILALEEVFDQRHEPLQNRIRDRLDDPEKSNALNLFSTSDSVRADARMDIVNNSTHWYSDYNRETREAVLSGMNSGERGTLDAVQLTEVRETITSDLDEHQRDISLAYLEGNRERAVAARTREALDNGRKEGQWGWIFSAGEAQRRSDQARVDAIAGMDAMLRRELAVENAFATSMNTEELGGSTDQVYREFASLRDPLGRSAKSFTAEEGRRSVINYATQSHTAAVLNVNPLGLIGAGPLIYATPETINMSDQASGYIEAAVMHGGDSDEARSARGVYEIARARSEGGSPSETTQTRLSDALENRALASLERDANDMTKTPAERSRAARLLAEERTKHRARLQDMACGLGAPEDVAGDPAAAEAWMRDQVGDLFAETDSIFQTGPSHRRYGEEMITMGRASLDASVALATDGWGTHDDLLTRGYTDRSHAEIDAANARWSEEHGGESMEEMLGLRNGRDSRNRLNGDDGWWSGFGAETSGDQTMGLEILALGNPENDLDRIAIANLRHEHQRVRGTGFIAERSMAGTDEQRFLDGSRVDMARVVLAEAVRRNPELAGRFDEDPLAIFDANGNINSDVARAAFEDGNFRGSATELHNATAHIGYAADAYRAEIDRQESMLTTGITVLALIASIALMCIPGVNVVAAGIITAVIAGAATIAVKYGMRGERYGWEEAATDVATTAIEVATAGIGGALAGGLGKAGMAGRLAKIGDVMVARLGKVGGAIAREAIVSAVSSAASTAIQDDTWKDGLGAGLGRLANSAIRGAVVSAISTGVSESLTGKLNTRMAVGDVDPANMTRWQKMATTIGPHGSEMIREGISNGVGTFASEAVGVVIDYAQGNFRGDFGDALKQVGLATLRETATSAIRGGVTSLNREHYRQLLDVARSGGPMSDGDLKALRLFAISAGAMNYDSDLSTIRKEVDSARDLLGRMPPGLREHASAMDADTLSRLVGMLESADLGDLKDSDEKAEFLRELGESVPGLDARALMAELNNAISRRAPADTEVAIDPAQQNHLRTQLGSNLHEGLKFALDDVRLDGLQHLSDTELAHAAAMIASGKFNSAEADALMRAAKARNPELDEFGFLSNLQSAVKNSERAQTALNKNKDARRQGILDLVPEDAAPIFRHLPDEDIALAQRLIRAGDPGTPQQQDALFRAAQAKNPELTRDQFHQFMAKAAGEMRTRLAAEASAKRTAREETMTDVPEHLRSTLSVLPEAGLVELRLRQLEGNLSPAEKVRLIEMARKANPDVDVRQLSDAIDQTVATKPATRISETESVELRKHLLSGVPEDQRALIQNTPIMVLSDAEFAALARSTKGQAVTMIIDGKPVIVMREGANPSALREEGIHALQAHDPQWAKHIGSLDEQQLANWDDLPLEQQIVLYRDKVALELDAQQRMIASIETDIANAKSPQEKAALQRQLEQTQLAHTNLSRRMGEVGNMDAMDIANIKAGFAERPQWLDQPARLFNKADDNQMLTRDAEAIKQYRQQIEQQLSDDQKKHLETLAPEHKQQLLNALAHMSANGVDVGTYIKSVKGATLLDLAAAAPLLARFAGEIKDLSEFLKIVNFAVTLHSRLPSEFFSAQKAKLVDEISNSSIHQLRDLMPRLEIIIQLAHVKTGGSLTGEQARKFINGMKLLSGIPMADLHVHTTSLVDAVDIVNWIGDNLRSMNADGINALHESLAVLMVAGVDLKQLKTALEEWHAAAHSSAPEVVIFRHAFELELQRLITMDIDEDQSKNKLKEFFAQFPRLKKFVSENAVSRLREIMQISVERYFNQGAGWLEMRGLHTKLLENNPDLQDFLLKSLGGVIATVSRGKLSTADFRATLEQAVDSRLFLGFDISGQENETIRGRLGDVIEMANVVAEHNTSALNDFMDKGQLHEKILFDALSNEMSVDQIANLVKESGLRIGETDGPITPREIHEALVGHLRNQIEDARQRVDSAPNDAEKKQGMEVLLAAVGRLNRYNKVIIESVQRMNLLPHPDNPNAAGMLNLIGLTIHAGEQVARSVQGKTSVLGRLMDDIELAILSGTDRIGHGVILGLSFDADHAADTMKMLGFERVDANARTGEPAHWRRGGEKYTDADVRGLETRRVEALKRVAKQGITLEIPPTSNIILNNLGLESHPVLKMMQDVSPPPVLRISVSTDNPGIHHINAHSELALLISMGVSWPQAVRIVVEGFASRMGSRPMNIEIRQKLIESLIRSTPVSEQAAVISELGLRFPNINIPKSDSVSFENWLKLFINAALGGPENRIH